jgi:ABC-type microcin C transport system duplicated ATPase subunit YejF
MSANAQGAVLEIGDLTVAIDTDEGEAQILDHAHLSLAPGSIHGVVGESGCGKSTLLKAILGVLPKRSRVAGGSVRLGGRDLARLPRETLQREVRGREIGFIPQDPFQALNPVFRVETQLMEALATHGLRGHPRADRKAMRAHLGSLLKATPVVVDDPSLRRPGTSGASLLEPGSSEWFRAALLERSEPLGLKVRFVAEEIVGGWDPAAAYRTFGEEIERLTSS